MKKIFQIQSIVIVLSLLFCFAGCSSQNLDGIWVLTSIEVNGESSDESYGEFTIVITDNQAEFYDGATTNELIIDMGKKLMYRKNDGTTIAQYNQSGNTLRMDLVLDSLPTNYKNSLSSVTYYFERQ